MTHELALTRCGRIFYGTGIAGIGSMHFFLKGFRPLLAPIPPAETENVQLLIYCAACFMVICGILIACNKWIKTAALSLASFLLLFFVVGHLPNRLRFHPEIVGVWTDAIKLLALAGGACILSTGHTAEKSTTTASRIRINKFGILLYSIMLVTFGIDHFLYTTLVSSIVPSWIAFPAFWAYLTGAALLLSGLAIALNFFRKHVSLLLALMLLLWLLLLHIPYSFSHPFNEGVDIISACVCMSFCGIAMAIAAQSFKK